MTRTMYDSVNPNAIPTTAALVAGYVDGAYAWSNAAWARFPNAVKVRIAVKPSTNDGHVLDVEQGDATPDQAPGWVRMRRAAGLDPTVYCSESAWPTVRSAFRSAGMAEPHYWVAAYPGAGATVPAGAVAHQYADPQSGPGGNWDLSAVADVWPGVDQGGTVTEPVDITAEEWAVWAILHNQNVPHGPNAGTPDGVNLLAQTLATINAKLDALSSAVAGVDNDVKAVGTPTVSADQLAALEQAVTSAVTNGLASQATPAQIAQATVTLFAQKLGAAA